MNTLNIFYIINICHNSLKLTIHQVHYEEVSEYVVATILEVLEHVVVASLLVYVALDVHYRELP